MDTKPPRLLGVSWHPIDRRWHAKVRRFGIMYNLPNFISDGKRMVPFGNFPRDQWERAGRIRDAAAALLGMEVPLNFDGALPLDLTWLDIIKVLRARGYTGKLYPPEKRIARMEKGWAEI